MTGEAQWQALPGYQRRRLRGGELWRAAFQHPCSSVIKNLLNSAAKLTLNLQAPRKAGVLCYSFPCAGSGRDWAGKVLRLCSFSIPWGLVGSGHQNILCLALTERWKTQECMCTQHPAPFCAPSTRPEGFIQPSQPADRRTAQGQDPSVLT